MSDITTSSWSAAGRPARRRRRSRRPRTLGAAARPGRTDQALRRRDPAAPDPRIRDPEPTARRPGAAAPHGRALGQPVDMPIEGGFVGMVDRDDFDEWLRERAADGRDAAGGVRAHQPRRGRHGSSTCPRPTPPGRWSRAVGDRRRRRQLGGRRQCVPGADRVRYVFAYHEIVRAPARGDAIALRHLLSGALSPDFYAWVFPHGDTTSVGTGTAEKGFRCARPSAGCARRRGSTAPRPSGAKARRSR